MSIGTLFNKQKLRCCHSRLTQTPEFHIAASENSITGYLHEVIVRLYELHFVMRSYKKIPGLSTFLPCKNVVCVLFGLFIFGFFRFYSASGWRSLKFSRVMSISRRSSSSVGIVRWRPPRHNIRGFWGCLHALEACNATSSKGHTVCDFFGTRGGMPSYSSG